MSTKYIIMSYLFSVLNVSVICHIHIAVCFYALPRKLKFIIQLQHMPWHECHWKRNTVTEMYLPPFSSDLCQL